LPTDENKAGRYATQKRIQTVELVTKKAGRVAKFTCHSESVCTRAWESVLKVARNTDFPAGLITGSE